MNTKDRKEQLTKLIAKYTEFKKAGKLDFSSEETIRIWINDLLEIFGWNVRDTSQILQEKVLSKKEREKLAKIGSTSTRPDYSFVLGQDKITFLDAKGINVNIKENSNSAFQIKSYGWSILAPCAFITNFEEFAIYDCTYIPKKEQNAEFGRLYLKIEDYIDKFEILENHLLKENILKGKLKELYKNTLAAEKNIERLTPDFKFAEQLSIFRLKLATNILNRNYEIIKDNTELLAYLVQVIINRVIFIRVCEARKIEKENLLLDFKKSGFWIKFQQSSYNDFYKHYDGPLFDKIRILQDIKISDTIFNELIDLLYYPSPYRFDVIPTKLLSNIYEIFLSRKLIIKEQNVIDALKLEYIKTNGAVSTPKYLVQDLIKRTLLKSYSDKSIEDFFKTTILDFACGSGIFLIEIFEFLEEQLINILNLLPTEKANQYFIKTDNFVTLKLETKRQIISNCIFGVDIDPEAVEVARMSLSLKIIDNNDLYAQYTELGVFSAKILHNVGENIKCGNSLVANDIKEKHPSINTDNEQLFKTNPYDWNSEQGFETIFEQNLGFDFILTNPPYVEVKNYNLDYPLMHQYLKTEYETTKNGKIDLSVAFIEQAISLLNPNGKLGFIIQKRFFKTQYGKKIRNYISTNQLLSEIIDFEATDIFPKRITYIASFILDKSEHDSFNYRKITGNSLTLPFQLISLPLSSENLSDFIKLPLSIVTQNPWNFEDAELLKINADLHKLGKVGDVVNVKVGIQVLWDKAYHIKVKSFNEDNTITGDTHLEENITIEIGACRPLIVNEKFYPFKIIQPTTYVLFPYDSSLKENEAILFDDFLERFPLAGTYLNNHKQTIISEVETWKNQQRWHLFTRVQNHKAIYPKVLIPMTANDTFASISQNTLHYCDNANVFFIELPDKSKNKLYAFSAILNSTLFSVCARMIANPQSNGYFKFNKQFIEPIPFPVKQFTNNEKLINTLSDLSKEIEQKQQEYVNATPKQKNIIKNILKQKWNNLDNIVYELYNLTQKQKEFFVNRKRNINRIDLLD